MTESSSPAGLDLPTTKSAARFSPESSRRLVIATSGLLALTALIGWCINERRLSHNHTAALRSIEKAGGFVQEEPDTDSPLRLRTLLGIELPPPLILVNLQRTTVTDGDLIYLGGLRQLSGLELGGRPIQGDFFAQMTKGQGLQYLDLHRTAMNDTGLRHLAGQQELVSLDLQFTEITDAGLSHLGSLSKLTSLSLNGTKIGDAGLLHLAKLENLEVLALSQTQVTDAGLAHLSKHTRLREVHLDNTEISDAGLSHVASLPVRSTVFLFNTQTTPAGIAQLRKSQSNMRIYAGKIRIR